MPVQVLGGEAPQHYSHYTVNGSLSMGPILESHLFYYLDMDSG